MLDPAFKQKLADSSCRNLAPGIAAQAEHLANALVALLFPCHASEDLAHLEAAESTCTRLLCDLAELLSVPSEIVSRFFQALPNLYQTLLEDAEATESSDPAATCIEEVILAYPGFYATVLYRLARELHTLRVPLVPRLFCELGHSKTGIDIHPGAQIGKRFVIDHGTGIVIGESTQIGDNVKLFQGVTLGALSVKKSYANSKRHPTIENNVVIYANATILGGDTVICEGSIIGGNAWVTNSVPPNSIITRETPK